MARSKKVFCSKCGRRYKTLLKILQRGETHCPQCRDYGKVVKVVAYKLLPLVCEQCGKKTTIRDTLWNKGVRRCNDCREKRHRSYARDNIKQRDFSLADCPWKTGDVRQMSWDCPM